MANHFILHVILLAVLPSVIFCITTVHHDKPEQSRLAAITPVREAPLTNGTNQERQKRLLPYINYYTQKPSPNQPNQPKKTKIVFEYQPDLQHSERVTPFLDSNALPGPFVPLHKDSHHQQPNYAVIYEQLAQLKHRQQIANHPQTFIETYTPTNIDVPQNDQFESLRLPSKPVQENVIYKVYRPKPQYITIPRPQDYKVHKPVVVYQRPNINVDYNNPKPQLVIDENYVAQKLTPVRYEENFNQYAPVQFLPAPPKYEEFSYPIHQTESPPVQNSHSLTYILKQLQDSNALPHTLTPDNIDNSIKTLVKILNGFKKQQKLSVKPIVVEEEASIPDEDEGVSDNYIPGTVSQNYPPDTVEGGTPGRPGVDYPALSSIPQTSFDCKTQRYKGFFGDPHTNCQVWHYCDLNGGQASFLCPNGTIFSQVALTCDWWYNVKCSSTAQLYVLNERLYKYILPLSPKFPEDYSGPLVDKYLALKFKEMEEKMSKDKKNETITEEKDDPDQLQELNTKNQESSTEEGHFEPRFQ